MAQMNLKEEAERRYPISLTSESISDSLRQIIINMIRLAFVDGCEYMAGKIREKVDERCIENYLNSRDAYDNQQEILASLFSIASALSRNTTGRRPRNSKPSKYN